MLLMWEYLFKVLGFEVIYTPRYSLDTPEMLEIKGFLVLKWDKEGNLYDIQMFK